MRVYLRNIIDKIKSSSKIKIILMFVILLPFISIICGSIIAKYIIIPATNKNTVDKKVKVVSVIKNNHIYNYYYMQAGVFASEQNANVLKNMLKNNEINSAVVKDNDSYRVIIAISYNDEFEDIKQKLKNIKLDYIVKEIKLYDIDDKEQNLYEINKYIEKITDIINNQIDIYYGRKNEVDFNKSSEVNDMMEQISKSDIDKKILGNLKTNNSIIIKSIENFKTCMQEDLKSDMLKNLANELFALKNFYDSISQY